MPDKIRIQRNDALADALGRLTTPESPVSVAPVPQSAYRPAEPPPVATDGIDWAVVVDLRRQVVDTITAGVDQWARDHAATMPALDRRLMGRSMIRAQVRDYAEQLNRDGQALWPLHLEKAYARAVEDAIFGFGRLQPLFEIATAENIEIHGWDSVVVQYGDGHREPHAPVADSDEELIEACRFLGQTANPPRPFDDAHPMMTLALGDKFRLHAIGFGLVDRPSITIRHHLLTEVTLADLADRGLMSTVLARMLRLCVLAQKSIVISGDQGAGKTTLLRALIDAIPDNERFGTLETDYELLTHLQPNRRNMVAFQARVGLGERQDGRPLGEYSVADLIPESLRQNLSRLIVGEVRGVEAGAMFEAMQAGAGTMSTTHAHSAASTIDRLASRVAQGGVLTIEEAYRQIAHNISLIIHVRLSDDTWRGGVRKRYIDQVLYATGGVENGRPVTSLLYQSDTDGNMASFSPDAALLDDLAPYETKLPNLGMAIQDVVPPRRHR
jgi:Flp pilus assembly CpaF family ATPase